MSTYEMNENIKEQLSSQCRILQNNLDECRKVQAAWEEDNKALHEALQRFVKYADGQKAYQDKQQGYITNFESSMVLQAKAALKQHDKFSESCVK